jgi:hypothetical protein
MTNRYLRITTLSAACVVGLAALGTSAFAGKVVTVPKLVPPPIVTPPPPPKVAAVKPPPVVKPVVVKPVVPAPAAVAAISP